MAMKATKKVKTGKVQKAQKTVRRAVGAPTQSWLNTQSAYLRTILDPFNETGCKIPDFVSFPSSTAQTIYRVQVNANSNGIAALVMRVGTFGTSADPTIPSFWTTGAVSTPSVPAYSTYPGYTTQIHDALDATYSRMRVVSAGLAATYQGATVSDSGRFLITVLPGVGGNSMPSDMDVDGILNTPLARVVPVARRYAQCLYIPADLDALMYGPAISSSYGSTNALQVGFLTIFCSGMVPAQTVEFTMVHNLECIPLTSSLNLIQVTPARVDIMEQEVATKALAESPFIATMQPMKDRPAEGISSGPVIGHARTDVHPLQQGASMLTKLVDSVSQKKDPKSSWWDTIKMVGKEALKMAPSLLALL